jgi:hypothetical protein
MASGVGGSSVKLLWGRIVLYVCRQFSITTLAFVAGDMGGATGRYCDGDFHLYISQPDIKASSWRAIRGFDESGFRGVFSVSPKWKIFLPDDDITTIMKSHVESRYATHDAYLELHNFNL